MPRRGFAPAGSLGNILPQGRVAPCCAERFRRVYGGDRAPRNGDPPVGGAFPAPRPRAGAQPPLHPIRRLYHIPLLRASEGPSSLHGEKPRPSVLRAGRAPRASGSTWTRDPLWSQRPPRASKRCAREAGREWPRGGSRGLPGPAPQGRGATAPAPWEEAVLPHSAPTGFGGPFVAPWGKTASGLPGDRRVQARWPTERRCSPDREAMRRMRPSAFRVNHFHAG